VKAEAEIQDANVAVWSPNVKRPISGTLRLGRLSGRQSLEPGRTARSREARTHRHLFLRSVTRRRERVIKPTTVQPLTIPTR